MTEHANPPTRKPYERPAVTVIGSVTEFTFGSKSVGADGGGTKGKNG